MAFLAGAALLLVSAASQAAPFTGPYLVHITESPCSLLSVYVQQGGSTIIGRDKGTCLNNANYNVILTGYLGADGAHLSRYVIGNDGSGNVIVVGLLNEFYTLDGNMTQYYVYGLAGTQSTNAGSGNVHWTLDASQATTVDYASIPW